MGLERIKNIFIVHVRLLKLADKIIIQDEYTSEHISKYKILRAELDEIKNGPVKRFDMD